MRNASLVTAAALSIASALLPSGSSQAQTVPPATAVAADSPAVADSAPAPLERVLVTALRLPTEIGTAPYALARNGPDVTRRARPGLVLGEALHALPGVQVDNRYNFALGERISIRGFGARTQFGIRGVRIVVDGIPATMPDGQATLDHLDAGTIASVEVVRTPMAALYGNAAGGVVAVQTLPPPPDPLVSDSRVLAGSHGLVRRQTSIGGSSGNTGYLVNVGRLDYGGYRAHSSADSRYITARTHAQLGAGSIALVAHRVRYDALNPGALTDSLARHNPESAFPANVSQRTGKRGEHSQAGITLGLPVGNARASFTGYGVSRSIENPIVPQIIDLSRRAGGARLGFGSDAGMLAWETGVEASVQRDDRQNFRNVGGEREDLTLEQDEQVRSLAAFATARAQLTSRIGVQAGLRRDAVRFGVEDHFITDTNPDDSGERTMNAWSPSAGISLRLKGDVHLFANVGTAFETPTTTELANRPTGAGGFNPELEPQRTLSHELGLNGAHRPGRLFYQFVLHRSRITGALVPFEVPGTPGRQFFRNAGSVVHRGAEAMIGAAPFGWLSGRLAYSHTDARYREYTVGEVSHAGRRVPGVAPHRLDGLLRIAGERVFADVESRYQSRIAVNDANTAHAPAHGVYGVRAGLLSAGGRRFGFNPYAGMDNVFGRRYISALTVNAAGARFYEPGPGRTFYIGTDVRFVAREAGKRDR